MPSNTKNLNLYKKNPQTDGEDTFNIETMINENLDKIDAEFDASAGHKHTGAAGDGPKITAAGLAAGAANDAAIGDRTADPATGTAYGLKGSITQWFSWITKYFKAITGKANPFDAPDITLAATKTHVDNTVAHITAAERAAWNAAETNAKNASIPLVQKGATSGVPALDAAKYMLGDGISLKEFSTETVHTFSFTHNVANQKVDLSTTGALAGFFEVTVTGTFGNQNNVGRMTKRFNIMTNTSGTINSQLTQYTEVTGPIVSCLSISDAYWSASSSQWRITIDARTSNGNGYAVHIKRLTSQSTLNTKPFTLGTPYTGTAATTLPIAVQTIPDDTVTQSGYLIQKHLLTDNSGKNIKLPNGTDLDTVLANGYYNGIALVNAPTTANVWYYIEVQQHTENSQFILQRATLMSGTAGDKPLRYERIRKLNVWSTWVEIEGADKKNVANGYAGVDVNVKVARVNTYNDLGGISALSNLDTAYTAGTYSVNANAVGTPSSGEYGQVMIHVSQGETHTDVNWIWQMFFGTAGNTFVRRKVNNGAWQNWVKLWTGYNDSILFLSRWMIPNGSDINAFTTNGCYSIFQPTGLTNFPAGVIYGILNVTMADVTTNYAKQEIMDCTNGTIYTRGRTGSSTWTPWATNITSAGGTMIAALARNYDGSFYSYRNLVGYNATGTATGTIKITLPKTWSNTMMSIKIKGYDYTPGKGAWELIVGGYNYSTTPAWANVSAVLTGRVPFDRVRLAHDGTNNCILLGSLTTVWGITHIEVSEFTTAFGAVTGWEKGWQMALITSETGIFNAVSPSLSGGGNADTLGGYSAAQVTQGTLSYAVTSGTAPTLVATFSPAVAALTAGLRVTIKAHAAITGPVTLNVNGLGAKSIKKPNGNNPPLALGGVYTVVYDGTAFILQGEGGEYGTATAAEVLAGKTIGTENGLVNGTMPDRTRAGDSLTYTTALSAKGDGFGSLVMEPQTGYYASGLNSGGFGTLLSVDPNYVPASILSTKTIFGVQGSVPVITSGEDPALSVGKWGDGSLAVYPREGYRKGGPGAGEIKVTTAQLRSVEGDLAPANIRSGVEVFGVTGTLVERMYAEGYTGAHYSNGVYQISGLSFKPRIVRFTFFKENSQSTFVYLGTDTERWNFVEYAGTNPYGTVISSGEMPSPSSWGNGFSAYLNFSGISVNILWNAWR